MPAIESGGESFVHYYAHHLGDWSEATAHLSFVEDAAYSRCVRKYYADERPLPADVGTLQRLLRARSRAERQAIEKVLSEFFTLTDDGWRHKRCDEEIERYHAKRAKAARSANVRWNGEPEQCVSEVGRMRTHCEGIANQNQNQTQNHSQEPKAENVRSPQRSEQQARTRATSVACPFGVSPKVWEGFLALRKAKRAPVTEAALAGIEREAHKAGISLEEALGHCCARGWAGFQAAWLHTASTPAGATETFKERDERNARRRWEEWTGRTHPDNLPKQPVSQVIDITSSAALLAIGASE